jgi:PTS system nitrogen regulatory IIA component
MIHLQSILTPARTLCSAPVDSKIQALANIARFVGAALPAVDSDDLLNKLSARERLGSTGLGNGIAIPHCRLKNLDAVAGALITLEHPIDFDAVDDKPVDILFALLAPEQATQEHLNALAALAALFNQHDFCQALRAARNEEQLYRAAIEFGN